MHTQILNQSTIFKDIYSESIDKAIKNCRRRQFLSFSHCNINKNRIKLTEKEFKKF